jgi:aryl-alcohol dehydrogenase-like predicted oxidoreductase
MAHQLSDSGSGEDVDPVYTTAGCLEFEGEWGELAAVVEFGVLVTAIMRRGLVREYAVSCVETSLRRLGVDH